MGYAARVFASNRSRRGRFEAWRHNHSAITGILVWIMLQGYLQVTALDVGVLKSDAITTRPSWNTSRNRTCDHNIFIAFQHGLFRFKQGVVVVVDEFRLEIQIDICRLTPLFRIMNYYDCRVVMNLHRGKSSGYFWLPGPGETEFYIQQTLDKLLALNMKKPK
ncbi:hypothetical protein CEXT_674351 [Caerostris extrusa]|uniref:LAGLIDADG homing endonuclease n=1 Tax=Caerostris extrusa TaxID=172846 RepID=A0AAV4VHF3_CAEEX|nr:hypothetical protein CEXT_674351 [Caerostris extrusa]